MRRRFNIIPFVHKPPTPDQHLEERLKAEWSGILRWMMDGCLDWQKNGLLRSQSVTDATESYLSDQDLFGQWIKECCEGDRGNSDKWETTTVLFNSWKEFAQRAGEPAGHQGHSPRPFSDTASSITEKRWDGALTGAFD